jgi:hypothetical protein
MMGRGMGNTGVGGGHLNASNRRLGLAQSGGVGVKGLFGMLNRTGLMAMVGPSSNPSRSVVGSTPCSLKAITAADPATEGQWMTHWSCRCRKKITDNKIIHIPID